MTAYEQRLRDIRAKGAITIIGASADEVAVIRAALNLYRTRNDEKETDRPGMGFGKSARVAEELEIRIA